MALSFFAFEQYCQSFQCNTAFAAGKSISLTGELELWLVYLLVSDILFSVFAGLYYETNPDQLHDSVKGYIQQSNERQSYMCTICLKEFAGLSSAIKYNAERHVLIVHVDANSVFFCSQCQVSQTSRNTMTRHLRDSHGIQSNIWQMGAHCVTKQKHEYREERRKL